VACVTMMHHHHWNPGWLDSTGSFIGLRTMDFPLPQDRSSAASVSFVGATVEAREAKCSCREAERELAAVP
jgi:hypothetical protein